MRDFALTFQIMGTYPLEGRTIDEMRSSRSSLYVWICGGIARGCPGSVVTLIVPPDDSRGDLHSKLLTLLFCACRPGPLCHMVLLLMSKLGGLALNKNARYPLPIFLRPVGFFGPRSIFGPRSTESCLALTFRRPR